MENVRRWLSGAAIAITAFVLSVIVLAVGTFPGANGDAAAALTPPSPSPSATAAADPEEEGCTTWATAPSDYTDYRWFFLGIAAIRNASTDAEAAEAAHVWLAEVRKDPSLLAGTAKYFLQRDVDPATLSTDGCATDAAVQLVTELELAISMSDITSEDAPANGYNTGVENGTVVGSATPGITGDRSAIKITLSDGRVIWIMARCGNIVTTEPPVVPPGTTDEPPTTTPPDDEKVPAEDPAPRNNAPEGGGRNADPGPGTYVEPTDMDQPPAAPRTNPPTPAPAEPETPTPPVGSTPDPAPAPAPEPEAPAPSAPAEGCSPAPGMTTC